VRGRMLRPDRRHAFWSRDAPAFSFSVVPQRPTAGLRSTSRSMPPNGRPDGRFHR
jgi:hypothetical protein